MLEQLSASVAWMAWTWQTGVFFIVIAGLLALMTVLAAVRPEVPQVGVLGIPTTRGDRLFLSLLGAAFIHLLWIGFAGAAPLWGATLVSLGYAAAMFRYA